MIADHQGDPPGRPYDSIHSGGPAIKSRLPYLLLFLLTLLAASVTNGYALDKTPTGFFYPTGVAHSIPICGIHPSLLIPATNWGKMPDSSWPDAKGFVNPIVYINGYGPFGITAYKVPDTGQTKCYSAVDPY